MGKAQQIVLGIQNAATRRDKADEDRRQAVQDLREWIVKAREERFSVTEIVKAAGLSRQGVYDLLSERPSR